MKESLHNLDVEFQFVQIISKSTNSGVQPSGCEFNELLKVFPYYLH